MASGADTLAGLVDIRGPGPTWPGLVADAALVAAGGMVLALLVVLVLLPLTHRRLSSGTRVARAMIATRAHPPQERAAALARLLVGHAGERGAAQAALSSHEGRDELDRHFATDWFGGPAGERFARSLYRPDPDQDLDAVEQAFLGFVRAG